MEKIMINNDNNNNLNKNEKISFSSFNEISRNKTSFLNYDLTYKN